MTSRSDPGLVNLGIQAQIAHKLTRTIETADVTNSGHERRRGREVDPRHSQQQLDRPVPQGSFRDDLVETVEFLTQELELAKARRHRFTLVIGQVDTIKPAQTFTPNKSDAGGRSTRFRCSTAWI